MYPYQRYDSGMGEKYNNVTLSQLLKDVRIDSLLQDTLHWDVLLNVVLETS